tara:strand:+ start:24 stop:539 length:516 start_codon:yes stop_codon:yes gene_type:complete
MRAFIAGYDRVIQFMGELPGYLIGLMAIGIGTEVAMRNFGFGGIVWMLGLVEYGILIVALSGAAWVLRLGRHVTVDIVTNSLPPALRRRVEIGAYAAAFGIAATLTVYGVVTAYESYMSGSTIFKSFELKEWVPVAAVPLGMAPVAIECLRRMRGLASGRVAPGSTASEGF